VTRFTILEAEKRLEAHGMRKGQEMGAAIRVGCQRLLFGKSPQVVNRSVDIKTEALCAESRICSQKEPELASF
jgi:hypothetical protein